MQVLGFQIDKPFIRAALIEKKRRGLEIVSLKTALSTDPGDVKQLYNSSFKGKIATGLSAKNLLVRSFEVNVSGKRHIEEAAAFQSEATSHFAASDVLSVPFSFKQLGEKTETLLLTAPREAIRGHLQELEVLELDPDIVSAAPLALMRYVQWKVPVLADLFIVDLGSSEWTCLWIEKGELKKSHSISGGVEDLLSCLWEDRKKILFQKEVEGFAKQIDLLQLKPNLNPHLSSRLNDMRLDLAKIIFSFHRIAGSRPIFFTGRIDSFGHLREHLVDGFKESICGECNRAAPLEELKHAIPIGLALEGCSSSHLQFRREEFFRKKNWNQSGAYALGLAIASLLFGAALINFGNRSVQAREEAMISSLQSSLERWDPDLKRSLFANGKEGVLDRWSQEISSHSKEYPYLMQAPTVSETLSWLSHHPLLSAMKKENDPLEILSLRYRLLQFPKIDASSEPYQAKVEIEFKAKNPTNARKFHEALLRGDERVDPSQEVSWEALSHSYRVSFYLKNRSPNVP